MKLFMGKSINKVGSVSEVFDPPPSPCRLILVLKNGAKIMIFPKIFWLGPNYHCVLQDLKLGEETIRAF